jgi:hypothetical protein
MPSWREWSSFTTSSSWSSPISLDTTTWMRALTMRMMTTTMEETPPQHLLLCHPHSYATCCCATPAPMPPTAAREVIVVKEEDSMEMVPKQEAPKAHAVILAEVEPEPLQARLFNILVRDYEESPSRMMDDLDDWMTRLRLTTT